MSKNSQALSVGKVLNQKFRIIEELGSGAFGITYLVEHMHLGAKYVIKEYLPDFSIRVSDEVVPRHSGDVSVFESGLRCFYDEANLLYRLNHPNIVKVTDLFQAHGTAYFVMPYLGSRTLTQWINDNPSASEQDLLGVFIPLLEGLKYIHDQGLLHRDIKPDNVLIADDGSPVLIDFGTARININAKSHMFERVLTPAFAPFEQYTNKVPTRALDLYSLSAAMYQAITSELPPEAIDRLDDDVIIKLADSHPYNQRYSEPFLRAIDKGLAVHAADRHQDAMEMQNALIDLTNDLPVDSNYEGQKNSIVGSELEFWNDVKKENSVNSYRRYLDVYAAGYFVGEAKDMLKILQEEDELWQQSRKIHSIEAYQQYLIKFQDGRYSDIARSFVKTLGGAQILDNDLSVDAPIVPQKINSKNRSKVSYVKYLAIMVLGVLVFLILMDSKQNNLDEMEAKEAIAAPSYVVDNAPIGTFYSYAIKVPEQYVEYDGIPESMGRELAFLINNEIEVECKALKREECWQQHIKNYQSYAIDGQQRNELLMYYRAEYLLKLQDNTSIDAVLDYSGLTLVSNPIEVPALSDDVRLLQKQYNMDDELAYLNYISSQKHNRPYAEIVAMYYSPEHDYSKEYLDKIKLRAIFKLQGLV